MENKNNDISDYDSVATDFASQFTVYDYSLKVDSSLGHVCRADFPGIKLCSFDISYDFPVFSNAVDSFLFEWSRLVSLEPFVIRDWNYTRFHNGDHHSEIYIEEFYNYPLYNQDYALGHISVRVNNQGELYFLRSTLLPQLPVPEETNLTLEEVLIIINGYKYTIHTHTEQFVRYFDTADISQSAIEVYVLDKYDEIKQDIVYSYHLVWRISNDDGDFMIDSQTGDILRFIPNRKFWIKVSMV